ncbi:uncharacterized protein Fot_26063 [Forsythia ovata]|uniref:Myb/SANT-like domain-containing protein n=1 Tax=Forsythia ovata TaxID=205694 RepID=A0ABD1UC43_9LAMI
MDDNDTNSTQVDPSTKIRQVRWNDEMDGFMIIALVNQVLVGHKRSDNGFTSFQISKAIESVKHECGIVVIDKNVRTRLKTLKREYAKGKPDFGKWRTKLCRRYDDMECIFGNDTATGDRAVSGFDNFSPMQVDDSVNELDTPTEDTDPSPTPSRKRHSEEGTSTDRFEAGNDIVEEVEDEDEDDGSGNPNSQTLLRPSIELGTKVKAYHFNFSTLEKMVE